MISERLPEESEKAFEAFQTYLALGHERSHERVGQQLCKSKTLIDRWSSQYRWQERLQTYNSHLAAVQLRAEEENLKEEAARWSERARQLKEQEWEMSEKLLAKANDMLAFPVTQKTVRKRGANGEEITVIQPAKWNLSDAARMVDLAAKLRRMAAGQATERSEISGPEGAPIRTEHQILQGLDDSHIDGLLKELYRDAS